MSHGHKRELSQEDEAMYNLGHQYGGAAGRNAKPYDDKGPRTARLGRENVYTNNRLRMVSPLLMRRI